MKSFFFSLLFIFALIGEEYEFTGLHFVGSYLNCDPDIMNDAEKLDHIMRQAIKASGATILSDTSYEFSPAGLTLLYLLSESHASIHTYPEHKACFVDLFTCGTTCSPELFHQELLHGLNPEQVDAHLFLRDHLLEELSSFSQKRSES